MHSFKSEVQMCKSLRLMYFSDHLNILKINSIKLSSQILEIILFSSKVYHNSIQQNPYTKFHTITKSSIRGSIYIKLEFVYNQSNEVNMNIAIIYGGKSSEHEVSLVSASSIVRTIDKQHNIHLIGITKKGEWFLHTDEERERILQNEKAILKIKKDESKRVQIVPGGGTKCGIKVGESFLQTDVVFAVLHGRFGEDGTIQGLFEMADIPYVGGDVMSTSIAMDKEKTKMLWDYAGLPIVPYIAVKSQEWKSHDLRNKILAKIEKDLDYPVFVKPCRAGSSVGAGRVQSREELITQVEEAFLSDNKILIEACIEAREIECSVTGNTEIIAYIPGEIIPTHKFYDYDAKYTDPNGAELKIPADLDDAERKTIREIAIKAYQTLDLSGLSRVDFFIDKRNNKIYLNEVNTIPGFTSISMFPKMCEASGLPYNKLIMHLIDLAINRFNTDRQLKTIIPN